MSDVTLSIIIFTHWCKKNGHLNKKKKIYFHNTRLSSSGPTCARSLAVSSNSSPTFSQLFGCCYWSVQDDVTPVYAHLTHKHWPRIYPETVSIDMVTLDHQEVCKGPTYTVCLDPVMVIMSVDLFRADTRWRNILWPGLDIPKLLNQLTGCQEMYLPFLSKCFCKTNSYRQMWMYYLHTLLYLKMYFIYLDPLLFLYCSCEMLSTSEGATIALP